MTTKELNSQLSRLPIDRLRRLADLAHSQGDHDTADAIEAMLPTSTFLPRKRSWLHGRGCIIVVVRERGTSRQSWCHKPETADDWDPDMLYAKELARAAVERGAHAAAVYNVRQLHACRSTDLVYEVETPANITGEE